MKASVEALVMRPSLAFTTHRSDLDFVARGNIEYSKHLVAEMKDQLLDSQFRAPFDIIWPIAILNPAGLYLWAFAEVSMVGKDIVVSWFFNTRNDR